MDYKLKSVIYDIDLLVALQKAETDEDMLLLGFSCYRHMAEVEQFEDERLVGYWIWYKDASEDERYIVATVDLGNTHSKLALTDVPCVELLSKITQ